MSNLKRYTESWACGEYDGMEEDSLAGDWVKFDDIKELLNIDAQPLKVAIADYLDKEFCSNVSVSLYLAKEILKIIRQHVIV